MLISSFFFFFLLVLNLKCLEVAAFEIESFPESGYNIRKRTILFIEEPQVFKINNVTFRASNTLKVTPPRTPHEDASGESASTEGTLSASSFFDIKVKPTAVPGGMKFQGGEVLSKSPNLYVILYGKGWQMSEGKHSFSVLNNTLNNLRKTSWFQILSTYYDSKGNPIKPSYQYKKLVTPKQFGKGSNNYYGNMLSPGDVFQIIADALIANAFPVEDNAIYTILTSVEVYIEGACLQFCGLHTSFDGPNGLTLKLVVMPSHLGCLAACTRNIQASPNDLNADSMVETIAHELIEVMTDPLLDAWNDGGSQLLEASDICALPRPSEGVTNVVGDPTLGESSSKVTKTYEWNIKVGKLNQLIQQIWVNVDGTKGLGYCGNKPPSK